MPASQRRALATVSWVVRTPSTMPWAILEGRSGQAITRGRPSMASMRIAFATPPATRMRMPAMSSCDRIARVTPYRWAWPKSIQRPRTLA